MKRDRAGWFSFRKLEQHQAIIFVHGFLGDPEKSWQRFADALIPDPRFSNWDILSFGYGSRSSMLAVAAELDLRLKELSYRDLVFITHDVGGLIVQNTLVDHEDLAARVRYAFFFASPNRGMSLRGFGGVLSRFLLPGLQQYVSGNVALDKLDHRWNAKFGNQAPFEYWTIAGDRDAVVSAVSLTAFPAAHRLVVPGDHISITKPESPDHPSVMVVTQALSRRDVPEPARKAAEPSIRLEEKLRAGISDVFLYCNPADDETVLELAQQLRTAAGIEPWLVIEKAKLGRPWDGALIRDIDQMKTVVICIGSAGPRWRENEQAAVAGEFAKRQRDIIPVYLSNCPPSSGDLIPDLQGYPAVDLRQPGTNPMERLIEGISGRKPFPPRQRTPPPLKGAEPLKDVVKQPIRRRVLMYGAGVLATTAVGWKGYEWLRGSQPEGHHSPAKYIRGPSSERVLVFVHGLYGDAKNTWSSLANYWPEMLTRDDVFKDTDIYVAAYDTGVGNRMDIYELAIGLDQSMRNDGIFAKHGEVIFVCHSLGGLVVQRFLLTNRSLASKVKRIYFYSTPNEGAGVAAVGKILSADPLLHEMGNWEQHLRTIEFDWKSAKFSIKRYCAYEIKDVNGIRVVAEASATRSCDNVPVAINKNHIDIVKPNDERDPTYTFLRNAWQEP